MSGHRFDEAVLDVLDEVVVQRLHSLTFAGLHDGGQLERLAFANQVRHRRVGQQHFVCRDAAAALLLAELLRDDAAQRLRQHHADLLLPIRRELIDDPVDGLGGALGVNPQGSVMAYARRNAMNFIHSR